MSHKLPRLPSRSALDALVIVRLYFTFRLTGSALAKQKGNKADAAARYQAAIQQLRETRRPSAGAPEGLFVDVAFEFGAVEGAVHRA